MLFLCNMRRKDSWVCWQLVYLFEVRSHYVTQADLVFVDFSDPLALALVIAECMPPCLAWKFLNILCPNAAWLSHSTSLVHLLCNSCWQPFRNFSPAVSILQDSQWKTSNHLHGVKPSKENFPWLQQKRVHSVTLSFHIDTWSFQWQLSRALNLTSLPPHKDSRKQVFSCSLPDSPVRSLPLTHQTNLDSLPLRAYALFCSLSLLK